MLGTCGLVCVGFIIVLVMKPPTVYESVAIVRVPARPDMSDPVKAVTDLLTSNSVLNSVAGEDTHNPSTHLFGQADAVAGLRRKLSDMVVTGKGELYEIRCQGVSPESAQMTLTKVLESLITLSQNHKGIHQSIVELADRENRSLEVSPENTHEYATLVEEVRRRAETDRDYFAGIKVVQWPTVGTEPSHEEPISWLICE